MVHPEVRQEDGPEQELRSLFPSYISEPTRKAIIELCQHVSPEQEQRLRFARQCLAYIGDFLDRYPQIPEALFRGEELGGTAKQQRMHAKAEKKYKGRDIRRGELWNGAGEHTLAVGMLSEILARKMGLSEERVSRVALAGGLHDWWKKHEIMHMWDAETQLAAAGIPLTPETALSPDIMKAIRKSFDVSKIEDQQKLRSLGVPEAVIILSGAGQIRDKQGPRTDEELIIFYLDHIMSGVKPTTMTQRLENAVGRHPGYIALEASYKEELGGYTSHELLLQTNLGRHIEQRLARSIGYAGTLENLHTHITQLFVEAVRERAAQEERA